ncbi:hypothetical protein ACHAXN_000192, partial [Cyclotella atomus]
MRLSMTKLLILLLSPLSPIVTSLPHERLASSRFAFRSSSSTVASTSQYGISGFTKYSAHPGAIKGSDPILKAKLENKDRNLKKSWTTVTTPSPTRGPTTSPTTGPTQSPQVPFTIQPIKELSTQCCSIITGVCVQDDDHTFEIPLLNLSQNSSN